VRHPSRPGRAGDREQGDAVPPPARPDRLGRVLPRGAARRVAAGADRAEDLPGRGGRAAPAGAPDSLAGPADMRLTPLTQLTGRERDSWHALRAANPALDSPYFHP